MSEHRKPIPVFMPGNDRQFDEVAGLCTISDKGEINIKLNSMIHGKRLMEYFDNGTLIACAFDYMHPPNKET